MSVSQRIVISVEGRFADGILNGTKIVELRRRRMRVDAGATVWLYAKVPVGAIVGGATVVRTHALSVSAMWNKFKDCTGLTRAEYRQYFDDMGTAFALELAEPFHIKDPISLDTLRRHAQGFHPPQFFLNVGDANPLGALLRESR